MSVGHSKMMAGLTILWPKLLEQGVLWHPGMRWLVPHEGIPGIIRYAGYIPEHPLKPVPPWDGAVPAIHDPGTVGWLLAEICRITGDNRYSLSAGGNSDGGFDWELDHPHPDKLPCPVPRGESRGEAAIISLCVILKVAYEAHK